MCKIKWQIKCWNNQNICQIDWRIDCQVECHVGCQRLCKTKCQIECKIESQIGCPIKYQNICQLDSDAMSNTHQTIFRVKCQVGCQNLFVMYLHEIRCQMGCQNMYHGGGHSNSVSESLYGVLHVGTMSLHAVHIPSIQHYIYIYIIFVLATA